MCASSVSYYISSSCLKITFTLGEYYESYLTHLIHPQLVIGVRSFGPAAVGHQAASQCHFLLFEDKACLNISIRHLVLFFLYLLEKDAYFSKAQV